MIEFPHIVAPSFSLSRLMSISPTSLQLANDYLKAARNYQEHQQIYSAIVNYEKSLQLDPNQAASWHELGLIYCGCDRYQEGIICYLEALFIEIDNAFFSSLAAALLKIDRIPEAEEASANIISNNFLANFYPLSLDKQLNFLEHQSQIPGNCQQVFPSDILCLIPPINLDINELNTHKSHGKLHDKLHNKLHNELNYHRTHPTFLRTEVKFPAATVTSLSNGRVNVRDWASVITTSEDYLLPEISTGLSSWLFLLKDKPELQIVPGRVVVLARWAGLKYFHWLGEVFSACYLLSLAGIDLDEVDYFLVNAPFPKYQLEMLQILGISPDKILDSDTYPYIQAEELIIPYYGNVDGWFPKLAVDFLRNLFLSQETIKTSSSGSISSENLPKKVYLSRDQVSYRKVINELEVRDFLATIGFVTIIPESLSMMEQVSLFSQVEVIISPHGAGLTNAMFCAAGTKIIELFNPDYVYGCFWAIASQVDLDYYYLISQEASKNMGDRPSPDLVQTLIHPCYRDIYVEIPRLQQLLAPIL